jgi:hypothetical protein
MIDYIFHHSASFLGINYTDCSHAEPSASPIVRSRRRPFSIFAHTSGLVFYTCPHFGDTPIGAVSASKEVENEDEDENGRLRRQAIPR